MSELGYDVVAVPPDGAIARWYRDSEPGLSDDGRQYLYDCLLRGMRSDPLPQPRNGNLSTRDRDLIRDKARAFLPDIALVREGEADLGKIRPREPVQQQLAPDDDDLGF